MLRERAQWCLAAPDKSPLTLGGKSASSTNPSTWSSFDAVSIAAAARGLYIGYVLSADDPFTCIDLDVKDGTSQEHLDRFKEIVRVCDSYTELSRSGNGLHIWVKGRLRKGFKRDGVEIYPHARFIICTGNVHLDKPIVDRQEILDRMCAEMEADRPEDAELEELNATEEDQVVLSRVFVGSRKIADMLMTGDWKRHRYPSQSEADMAAMGILCSHTVSNEQVRRIFRQSQLGRRDKAQKDNRYLNLTLKQIRAKQASEAAHTEFGRRAAEELLKKAMAKPGRFRLLSDADLDQLPSQGWLVKGIIPNTSVGTIFGQSGTFKSFLALDLMAHVANGLPWFGRRVKAAPAVYVPFEGRGGIPKRVQAWRLAREHEGQRSVTTNMRFITDQMNLRLQADRDKLVSTLVENGWANGIVCIDTLAAAGVGIDENSSEGMGEMIAIFQELQRKLGGVILVVHHSGKVESAGLRGWSGLRGALDFSIKCQKDDDKNASKLAAQFVTDKVKDGRDGEVFGFEMLSVHIAFDADGDAIDSLTVMQPMNPAREDPKPPAVAERHAAEDEFVWKWISDEVATGKHPSRRSLEGQRDEMGSQLHITQKQLRDSISRLFKDRRLHAEKDGGNPWIRAVDAPTGV